MVHSDATYLITGGLGGFGLAVADWLVRSGARHVVLMSRSGAPREEDAEAFHTLLQSEAEIVIVRGDVSEETDVERVLRAIRVGMPPLKGVLHAAMMLDDDLLGRLDLDRFRAVLAPKVAGAWNLHLHTLEDDLDFFVLFSSGSSLIGIPAQGNYAAANAFLDTLAPHRRALGLPCLAVNWGAISGVGYVARHPELQGRLTWEGIESIASDEACAALERALHLGLNRVAVARIDWDRWSDGAAKGGTASMLSGPMASASAGSENNGRSRLHEDLRRASLADRRDLLERQLMRYVAKVLEIEPDRVDVTRSLPEMGMDSLMAVELQAAMRRDVGVEPPLVEMLGGVSFRNLVDGLLGQVSRDGAFT